MGVTRPPRVGVVGGVGWGVGLTTITRGYVFTVMLPEAVLVPASSSMVVDGGGNWNLTTGTWSGGVSDNAVACARTLDDAGRKIDGFEDVHVRDIGVACDVGCGGAEVCDADIGVGVVDCSYGVREVCDSAGEGGCSGYGIGEDWRGLGMCRWFGSISTMTRPTQCDLILLASIVLVDPISILIVAVSIVVVSTTSGRAEVNVLGVAAT